jgi:hypothetical protein
MKEQIKYIEDIEEFINHNLELGNLNENMTIRELLQFTKNIKENYMPMLKKIEDMTKL